MPLYEFSCEPCHRTVIEVLKRDGTEAEFCRYCGEQMRMVVSRPARVTPGKYGKGGGRGQVSNNAHTPESTQRP